MNLKELAMTVLAAVLMMSLTACGKSQTKGDFKTEYNELFPGGVYIAEYTRVDKDTVEIPSEINGEKVIGISVGAFKGHSEIKCIKIPESIDFLSALQFEDCPNLTDIDVAKSNPKVWSDNGIAYYGDMDCLVCPKGKKGDVIVSDKVRKVEYRAFMDCTGITSVTLPDSITSIGNMAFHNCSELTSISFGKNLRHIGAAAFIDCRGLTEVTLPDSVSTMDGKPFSGCLKIKVTYKGNTYDYAHLDDLYSLFKES